MIHSEAWCLLDNFFSSPGPLYSLSTRIWSPPVDISELPDRIFIRMEIAGIRREELSVVLEQDVLVIRGRRQDRLPGDGQTYHIMEVRYGCFERSFRLPRTIEPEGIRARYRDGFLDIEVPNGAGAPKSIQIPIREE